MRQLVSAVAVCILIVAILGAPPASGQDVPENPIAMSDESVASGLSVYVRFCRSCHATGGVGGGPGAAPDVMPPSLVDDECYEGCRDGEVFNAIRNGVPPDYYMEPWEGRITDDDIWNIVNYLNSLKN